MTIAENFHLITERIREYEIKYNRPPKSVTLLAASKEQSAEQIIEACEAGQLYFGENYLQEALKKIEIVSASPHMVEWHFIGPIQSNKTKKIAEHFAWVHSVDSEKIAQRLNDQRPDYLPPLNICIEVNISQESTKSGVPMDSVESLATLCASLPRIKLRGLMAIPEHTTAIEDQRNSFHQLFIFWQQLREKGFPLDTLSIGMTNDFEAAIAEGSTMVRIGTALFGPRT